MTERRRKWIFSQPLRNLHRKQHEENHGGIRRTQAKPPWVKREVIRLKALMPDEGCRKIAAVFNRLQGDNSVTVGKTFVSLTIRHHRYEIQVLLNKIKHRKPPMAPKNLIWQIDLTGKPTDDHPRQSVLGIIDHGTRACVKLVALPRKTSIRILIALLEAMERFGTPRSIRTDNEAVFTSRWFRIGLGLLGVEHQRIEMHCPWQNGRIERMFLTLKQSLDQLEFRTAGFAQQLFRALAVLVQPRTPASALGWAGAGGSLERSNGVTPENKSVVV